MPKPYPREFRDEAVRAALHRDPGVTLDQIAANFDVHPMTLSKWLRQAKIDAGDKPGSTTTESEELPAAPERPPTWFEGYLAAWNSRDVDRVLSWMTDDIVFEDTTLGHLAIGTDEMRRFVKSFAKVPEARFEFVTGFDDGATFAMQWVMQPMQLRGATIGSLRGDRVCAHRDFYDGAQFQPTRTGRDRPTPRR